MADRIKLNEAVDALDSQHHLLGTISREKVGNWKLELVRARRELAQFLAIVSSIISTADAEREHSEDQTDTEDLERVRSRLSKFRHALAMHQASYPAVSIESHDGYRKSADTVDAAHAEFMTIVRRVYHLPVQSRAIGKP